VNKLNLLIIGYNRVSTLQRVLNAIPCKNLGNVVISIDGPKEIRSDIKKVEKVKQLAYAWRNDRKNVTIICNKFNSGCRIHVQKSMRFFFQNNDQGAILEDDCVPGNDFFRFTQNMLEKYRNQKDILTISGTNLFSDKIGENKNNILSKYPHSWGWATWKDRLDQYDTQLKESTMLSEEIFLDRIYKSNPQAVKFWLSKFSKIRQGVIDTWDYQLVHLSLKNSYKNIIPPKNLITNIGFGLKATHTKNYFSNFSKLKIHKEELEISASLGSEYDDIYDNYYENLVCKF
jgi:hypothetical protein